MDLSDKRSRTLDELTSAPLDLLVIGGGIVGASIARDAAQRGLRIGLVEQHDFAFGTSSRSSRLLHGGLRYLAQGRIRQVQHASHEKMILHRIAPHLAQPLPFVFPTYRDHPEWPLWQLKIGVKLYDLLCGGHNLGNSSWLSPEQLLRKHPGLRREMLTGAVRYYDALTNDARLVIDSLRSAAHSGALVLNYAKFVDANSCLTSRPPLTPWECVVEDRLVGKQFIVKARAVVNAAGPWSPSLPHSRVRLRLTKGVHLVVDRARLPVDEAVVMMEGRRILFAIPWCQRTILGTTDTDFDGSPNFVFTDPADTEYLLGVINQFFPGARLKGSDVISNWAGVRPLVADSHGNPSDISRSHEIRLAEPGWWDITGGKLTTCRLMAEQAVDRVVKALRAARVLTREIKPCRTAEEPLLSTPDEDGSGGVCPPEWGEGPVLRAVEQEWAVHLDDVMVRRTSWHYYLTDAAERARRVADWMGEALGWDGATRRAELERYRQQAGMRANSLSGGQPMPSTRAVATRVKD
ncbi:MAG TPA: glycerol-3-phosphate dehydrogenase/oxidase [Verrucomicrobiota bacterium]|nr:glycerol-3-phosphate dehydrogenase/oxidase [Verrucomicrobiota bacterium]